MLILKWTFLAVVSASIQFNRECYSDKEFPLLPPDSGNYKGRNFDLVAAPKLCDYFPKVIVRQDGTSFLERGKDTSALVDPHNGCNLNDLKLEALDVCHCENIYERDSLLLIVRFLGNPNEWEFYLGSQNRPINKTATQEYVNSWWTEFNVTFQNYTPEASLNFCSRLPVQESMGINVAWFLVILIPIFLTVISMVRATLENYIERRSNRVDSLVFRRTFLY